VGKLWGPASQFIPVPLQTRLGINQVEGVRAFEAFLQGGCHLTLGRTVMKLNEHGCFEEPWNLVNVQ